MGDRWLSPIVVIDGDTNRRRETHAVDGPGVPVGDESGEPVTLPLYGVEGWRTADGFVTSSGLMSLSEDGPDLSLSVSGRQRNGEAWVEVTSYRRGRTPMAEVRGRTIASARRLGAAPRSRPDPDDDPTAWSGLAGALNWAIAVIRVDDVPTEFQVADVEDGWAAVGEGPWSTIALAARKVAAAEIALVRLPDPPIRHRRPGRHRPPRARSFPAEALTDTDATFGAPNVDLTFTDDRLAGTYQGLAIDLELHVPRSSSRASGDFAGSNMAATWQLGDNYHEHPDVHSRLHGRFADQTITVTGTFRLDEDWAIDKAAITGRLGDQTIEAAVTALDGGLSATSTVAIDGHCAETAFALAATISGDLRHAIIIGKVNNTPIRLDAHRRSNQPRKTHVTGHYNGPPVLLAFIVPTLLHFI